MRIKARVSNIAEPFHSCPTAVIAGITEPNKGELYLLLGEGDHNCQRWKISESLARKLRRELNERLD
jgi:hypothetical protein